MSECSSRLITAVCCCSTFTIDGFDMNVILTTFIFSHASRFCGTLDR